MIILLSANVYDFNLSAALEKIPQQRRDYALKYKRELDRRLCVKGYLLLCEGLKDSFGISEMPTFVFGLNGKPVLADYPSIHFSISHCDEAVICVIDDKPVGVDIERIKPYDQELVQYTMNSAEQELIACSENPAVGFTRLWTMKEAVLKCSGEGISNNLHIVLTDCKLDISTHFSSDNEYVYSICSGLIE